jgi:REP element-mobilizing transposase RayT
MPLKPDTVYHIYNRGNNREDLFKEERNYPYFLDKYFQYVSPLADTYAYCLMKNHFHILLRIKNEDEILRSSRVSLKVTRKVLIRPMVVRADCSKNLSGESKFRMISIFQSWSDTFTSTHKNMVFHRISPNTNILPTMN